LAFPPEALDPVLDEGVPIVTFSWGMPAIYAERVRRAGVTLGVQVATVEAAKQAVDLGAHFLIVQGVEAGGHVQSSQPLVRLLEAVVDLNLPIPIVAAGGIVNHEDIQRALGMGASAAMLGTRFVATKESLAHSRYKEALAHEHETALTICFDGGWPNAPHRVLRNKTLVDWESMGCPRPGNRPGENDVLARSASGEPIYRYEDTAPREGMSGQIEEMCLYAGTGVDRIADIPSVSQLMQSLWPLS
jgi:nitronate monooxygenase